MTALKRVQAAFAVCAVATGACLAAVQVYHIEPRELHEGWTEADPNAYVAQTFRACSDSLDYIEWFVGDLSIAGSYVFDVVEAGTNRVVAHGLKLVPAGGWQWVRCDSFTLGDRHFVKGRDCVVKVSHSAGDSVCYVYRTDDPYGYGSLVVDGTPQAGRDLCLRVYSTLNPVPATFWGMGQAA